MLAAYILRTGNQADVYLSHLDAKGALMGPRVRVNHVAGEAAGHAQAPPQVAVGPDGTVYVAWLTQRAVEGRRFPASDIRLARSEDGGKTFQPAIMVNEEAGIPTSHHFHNLAVGPDGTVYVSWLDATARDRAALNAKLTPSHHHHGGAASDEDPLPGTELHVARSIDGGRSFDPGVVVARGTCQCCRTALAVSQTGILFVGWRHIFEGRIRDIALARSADGGRTFSEPVIVHEDAWMIDGCPHSGPAISVEAAGGVHVVWYTGADGREGVYHAFSEDAGQSFGPSTALTINVPVAQVSAAPAARRGAWLAWEHPLRDRVYVLRVEGSVADASMADSLSGRAPAVATAGTLTAFTWTDDGRVQMRGFEAAIEETM